VSNSANRRAAGFGIRRGLRGQPGGDPSPVVTPQVEVIANGLANLVCANAIQVVAGTA